MKAIPKIYIPFSLAVITSADITAALATQEESMVIPCSGETEVIAAGAGKVTFRMPFKMTISEIRATLTTAQAAGDLVTIDINQNGASLLTTKLTIDNTEKTSRTATTPYVLTNPAGALANDAEITIDIDQVGAATVAAGLKIIINGNRST